MNIPPSVSKKLRACLSCSMVKTQAQFREQGCSNCAFLKMKDNLDNVLDCTSDKFSGLMALTNPPASWVARWQRIDAFTKGLYALTVDGELPDEYVNALEREGRVYYPRDVSFAI